MICTCEKCKSAFFSDNPPLFCPECEERLYAFGGLDELEMLARLLSYGRVKESQEARFSGNPDKVPPLMDVVKRMLVLLDRIPESIWKKYRRSYYDVKNYLTRYSNGQYYERLKQSGIPKIETIGMELRLTLRSFLDKFERKAPSEEPEEEDRDVEVTEEEIDEVMKSFRGADRKWVRSMLEYGKKHADQHM